MSLDFENDPTGDGSGAVSVMDQYFHPPQASEPTTEEEARLSGDVPTAAPDTTNVPEGPPVAAPDVTGGLPEGPRSVAELSHEQAQQDAKSTAGAKSQDITPSVTLQTLLDDVSDKVYRRDPNVDFEHHFPTTANTAANAPQPHVDFDGNKVRPAIADAGADRPGFGALRATNDEISALATKMAHRGWDLGGIGNASDSRRMAALLVKQKAEQANAEIDMRRYMVDHPELYKAPVRVGPDAALVSATGKELYRNTGRTPTAAAAKGVAPYLKQNENNEFMQLTPGADPTATPYLTPAAPMPTTTSQGSPNFGAGDMIDSLLSRHSVKGAPTAAARPPAPHNIQDTVPYYIDSTGKRVANPGYVEPGKRTPAVVADKKAEAPAKADPKGAFAAYEAYKKEIGRYGKPDQNRITSIESSFHVPPGTLTGKAGTTLATSSGTSYTLHP